MTFADEPHRGGYFAMTLAGLPGIDQMRAAIDGRGTPPPMHHLTGMRPTAIGDGTSEFAMPASGWLASQYGAISGGLLAVLADGPLGCAIQSTLPAATPYTTSELSMSYLRPAFPDGRDLVARGRVIHRGRTLALSEATVLDGGGREVAHCTSRCFIFPSISPPPPAARPDPVERPSYDTPDPWQRPVEGYVPDKAALMAMSGLDQYAAYVAGDVPPPPLYHLTGARPVAAAEGTTTWTMPATPWLCSPLGLVEGGFLVYLADCAIAGATATLAPVGITAVSIDITMKFLRPAPPDGRDLTAVGKVVNAGRTLSVAGAEVRNADGKLVATALGSSMLVAYPEG